MLRASRLGAHRTGVEEARILHAQRQLHDAIAVLDEHVGRLDKREFEIVPELSELLVLLGEVSNNVFSSINIAFDS